MDALAVMNTMAETWVELLEQYYDNISDAHVNHIGDKFSLDKAELSASVSELKTTILNGAKEKFLAANSIAPETKQSKPKTIKKPASTENIDNGKYNTMNRGDIAELCKARGLPVRRKNQDMIDSLKKYDEENSSEASSSAPPEQPPPPKEKMPEQKKKPVQKKPEPSSSSKPVIEKGKKKIYEAPPPPPPEPAEESDNESEHNEPEDPFDAETVTFDNDIGSDLEEEDYL